MLARIEAEITTATNRGILCEKWGITHDAQISWATQKIEEARSEREMMKATIQELSEQVKQLTSRLDPGRNLYVQSGQSLKPIPGTARVEK